MAKTIDFSQILEDRSSFQLVRTNPKLTGNVKFTVDGNDKMWLNSIDANDELSKDLYKRVAIDPSQSLPGNMFRFFNNGSTPNEVVYAMDESFDSTKTSRDFKDQYDFSHYFSGAKYLVSKRYDEKMTYFAPLYLKKDVPDYFVIFKIDDPINKPIDQLAGEYPYNREEYIKELFEKASLIKTFDIRENTSVGKYIRDYVHNENFPTSPLNVNYDEDQLTEFNGILFNSGVMGSRGELLNDFYKTSNPLKHFEGFITEGFERNGVILPNILNMEFIFDDDTSELYDFNRYVGFYVNAIELSKFEVDLDRAYFERGTWENTPKFRREYKEWETLNLDQNNPDGVIIPFKTGDLVLSDFADIFSDKDNMYFNYINDRNNKLYSPKLSNPYDIDYAPLSDDITQSLNKIKFNISEENIASGITINDSVNPVQIVLDGSFTTREIMAQQLVSLINGLTLNVNASQDNPGNDDYFYIESSDSSLIDYTSLVNMNVITELDSAKIRMSNADIKLSDFYGPGEVFIQDEGFSSNVSGFSHAYIKIDSLSHLDEIKIYHPNGTRNDSNGNFDILIGTTGYALIPNPGEFYVYNDIDNVTGFDTFYFNIDGSPNDVVNAIKGCLNGIRNSRFQAFDVNEYAFIKLNVPIDFDDKYAIEFNSLSSIYSGITVNDINGTDLIGKLTYFEGGSKSNENRLIIDNGHYDKIKNNINDILVKTKTGWSKIKKISKYIDSITEENVSTSVGRSEAIESYFGNMAIVLDLDIEPFVEFKNFMIRSKHKPSFGLLSFSPIKDFDFDFYSSEYLNFPKIDLYKHYSLPPDIDILEENTTYEVFGEGLIEYDTYGFSEGTYGTFTVHSGSPLRYKVLNGNPIVRVKELDNFSAIDDGDEEYQNFQGFFTLKDPDKIIDAQTTPEYELRDKYINGIANSEYDYFKENDNSDFALRSKILPYITKWVGTDGTDSRNNPYRLNGELAFGFNNFSPDHEDISQNPANFTHEWFYIESSFNYLNSLETTLDNNSYFDEKFDENRCLSEEGYFTDYFTYTPTFNGEEVGKTQTRYSPINRNRLGEYQALFKGFKIYFKDFIDENNVDASGKPEYNSISNRFEDYKFSCILTPIKEKIDEPKQPPVRYRMIEHSEFKFVVLVIELNIGSVDNINDFWKTSSSSVDRFNFINPLLIPGPYPYDTINGDYRISFNADEVSDLTHTSIYAIKHKKYNNTLGNFSNIKLSSNINLNSSGVNGKTIENLIIPSISNYPSKLSEEIAFPGLDNFIIGKDVENVGTSQFVDSVTGFSPNKESLLISATESTLILSEDVTSVKLIGEAGFVVLNVPSPIPELLYRDDYVFKIMTGGEVYYESIFEKISFAKFKESINSLNAFIEYETYDTTGLISDGEYTDTKWFAEVPDSSSIVKDSALLTVADTNLPATISSSNVTGYSYEKVPLDNTYEINRYDGGFSPLFKNVFTFNSKYNFESNTITELDSSNTKFNINIDKFLKLNNFNHIKIANSKILTLESDDEFDPTYELINEIAIGRADYDLLTSNWDYGFHYQYTDKSTKVAKPGTLRVEEDDSFISKLVMLRDTIELELIDGADVKYGITKVPNLADVNVNDIDMVYTENDANVDGIINLGNIITKYLLDDGISTKFEQYLINDPQFIGNFESIEEYIIDYIRLNILKLYEVDNVDFYEKNDKTLVETDSSNSNTNAIEFRTLTDKERFNLGYKENKNLRINKSSRLVLTFSFAKRLNSGLLISPKVKIKFI